VPRLVEETFKTLGQPEAAHALVLMEELGLLEYVIPILSAHLKARGATLAEQPAVRNMAALGRAIGSGFAPDHSIVLAALMLDLYRDGARVSGGDARVSGGDRVDLLGELRARGFARGDTEQMRLILEAFQNLAAPTRRTRRLMRRPYYPDARMFFEMTAPTYSIDSTRMIRFLADPDAFSAGTGRGDVAAPTPTGDGVAPPAAGGNRRRRRRRRRRSRHGAAAHGAPPSQPGDGNGNGAVAPSPSPEPTRRD
jgi:hypothetical protein